MPDKKSTIAGTPKHYIDPDFDNVVYGSVSQPDPDKTITPEQRLWVAVLGQLIEDATLPRAKLGKSGGWSTTAEVNAKHARATVFAEFGTSAEDFIAVCDLAGFDPEFIRHCVSAAIERDVFVTRESFTKMICEQTETADEDDLD